MELEKLKGIDISKFVGAVLAEYKALSLVKEYPATLKRLAEINKKKDVIVFSGELRQLHKKKEQVESVLHLVEFVEEYRDGSSSAFNDGITECHAFRTTFSDRLPYVLQQSYLKNELKNRNNTNSHYELDDDTIKRYESFEIDYESIEESFLSIDDITSIRYDFINKRFQKSGFHKKEFYTNEINNIVKFIAKFFSKQLEYVSEGKSVPQLEDLHESFSSLLVQISLLKTIVKDFGIVISKNEEKEMLNYKWAAPLKWKADKTALGTIFGVLFEEGIIGATTPANINNFIRENFIDSKGDQFKQGTLKDNIELRESKDKKTYHHGNTRSSMEALIKELKSQKK